MRTILTQPLTESNKYRKIFSIPATSNIQSYFFGNKGRGFAKFSIVAMNTGQGAFSSADFVLYNYNGINKIFCTKTNNNVQVFGNIENDTFTVYAKAFVNLDFVVLFDSSYESMYSFYDYDMAAYDKSTFTNHIGINIITNQPLTLPVTWESGYTPDALSYTNNRIEISENGRYIKGQLVCTTTNTLLQNIVTLPIPIQKTRFIGHIMDSYNRAHPFLLLQNQGTGVVSSYFNFSSLTLGSATVTRIIIDIDSPVFASSYPKGINIPGV